MQKILTLVILQFLWLSFNCSAQNKWHFNERRLGITLGNGYDDGWISLTKLPTLGIVYNQSLRKRLSARIGFSSFYRTMPDSYLYNDSNGHLVANIIVRDSESPFITDADREKITKVGIKDLNSSFTIKSLSAPLDFGIMFIPFQLKRHYFGIFAGAALTFESMNWWRDFYSADLTLKDGTVYNSSFLALNTEFRSLTLGECIKVEYGYKIKSSTIALNISESNLALSHPSTLTFYNVSLCLYAKI